MPFTPSHAIVALPFDTAFPAGTFAGAAILVVVLLASIVVRLLRIGPPENRRHDSQTADQPEGAGSSAA